jgi:ATP-binding cassette subfamily B protein/subfamily B ATP-binding cassette protein MsbA
LLHTSGQLDAADNGFLDKMGELERNARSAAKLGSVLGPLTAFLPMFMIALIAGMNLMVFGTRNSGILPSLVTFVLALQRWNGSFGAVAGNFSALASNSAPIHRLNEILDTSDKQFRGQGGAIFSIAVKNHTARRCFTFLLPR